MKKLCLVIILIVVTFLSSCQKKFNQKVWLDNSNFMDIQNPRVNMVNDLMHNYLKVGMKKIEVIKLLGKPRSDTIGVFLPKELKPPDSLHINNILNKTADEREKYISFLNDWYNKNYKSAPMLKYPIGWSLSDPKFLVIRLNNENIIMNFEVIEY